jgi:hypothetical protein
MQHEQHGEPAQRHRIDMKEVRGEQPSRLSPHECSPVRVHLAGRRTEPVPGEDAAARSLRISSRMSVWL